MSDADDVLAHSEDEDEWEDTPVAIERRPSGSQVLSARIPSELAHYVFEEAARRNVSMSEVVRIAIESWFQPRTVVVVNVYPGDRLRFFRSDPAYDTANPVVTTGDVPLRVAV